MMPATMRWEGGRLLLLDQTALPGALRTIICEDYRRVRLAISRLEVRGAPAIGAAAAFAMVLGAKEAVSAPDFAQALHRIGEDLCTARPTAVNLAWGVEQIYRLALRALAEGRAPSGIVPLLEARAIKICHDDIDINKKIGAYGAQLLPRNAVLLTHCNAGALATCGYGTALGVVRAAAARGGVRMVYADETRPLLQGARLTAFELCEDKIPVTLITDGMAAWTMKTRAVDAVITGADRIAANGDTANKIGTYGLALAAQAHHVPFYVAAPLSTFDFTLASGGDIPIEERAGEEITHIGGIRMAPEEVQTYNPAFDVTPAGLITGIITEYGVLRNPCTEAISFLRQHLEERTHEKHD